MSQRHTTYPVGAGGALGTMIVVGGQSGGSSKLNVVPPVRLHRRRTVQPLREHRRRTREHRRHRQTTPPHDAGADISIQVTQPAPATDAPLTDPAAKLLGDCVTAVTGSPARYELCAGCLDTRWYSQIGIPAFRVRRRALRRLPRPERVRRGSRPAASCRRLRPVRQRTDALTYSHHTAIIAVPATDPPARLRFSCQVTNGQMQQRLATTY